jgi:hypothetical protein
MENDHLVVSIRSEGIVTTFKLDADVMASVRERAACFLGIDLDEEAYIVSTSEGETLIGSVEVEDIDSLFPRSVASGTGEILWDGNISGDLTPVYGREMIDRMDKAFLTDPRSSI